MSDIFENKLEPNTPIDDDVILVSVDNPENVREVFVLLKVEGDHPQLISIDLINGSYTVEGYD